MTRYVLAATRAGFWGLIVCLVSAAVGLVSNLLAVVGLWWPFVLVLFVLAAANLLAGPQLVARLHRERGETP